MSTLNNLFPLVSEMDNDSYVAFMQTYRARRAIDLEKKSPLGKKRTSKPSMEFDLAEHALLAKLGISPNKLKKLAVERVK